MDASRNSLIDINDFELHGFIDGPNFDEFIDVIRGENKELTGGLDYDLINGYSVDNQFGSATGDDMFGFNDTSCTMASDLNIVLNSLSSTLNENMKEREEEEEEDNDRDDSSDTTTRTTTATSSRTTKTDRSRTLISERRRRGRMKEKLYALRALVPNITKMDKASIVGDAVLYVQELQRQAKKLKTEIAGLESSLAGESIENKKKNNQVSHISNQPVCKKIMQMDVFQVEEKGFYLRLVCNKEAGVCVSLYKALESLTSFKVQNSNLATVSDRLVFTFTLNKTGERFREKHELAKSEAMGDGGSFEPRI